MRQRIRIFILTVCAVAGMLSLNVEARAQETLCILDFNRLGDVETDDWLKRGLADMMIASMNKVSDYRIVERKHLMELLKEQGLSVSGLVDETTAVEQARLTKAEYVLIGNFSSSQEQLSVQIRLISLSGQDVVSMAQWQGPKEDVNSAIRSLCRDLMKNAGRTLDPEKWTGIEKIIPRTIDVAQTYYQGLNKFDAGRYPEALAYFLDGLNEAENFLPIYDQAIELYYFLSEPKHSVILAFQTAQKLQENDPGAALEFYFKGFEKAQGVAGLVDMKREILERMIQLAQAYDETTQEAQTARIFLKDRIWQVYLKKHAERGKEWITFYHWDVLRDDEIFYRMWIHDISEQLRQRYDQGGYNMARDTEGNWVQKPVPSLTVWMWKTRAQAELARLLEKNGTAGEALAVYHAILKDYSFMEELDQKAQPIHPEGADLRSDLYTLMRKEAFVLLMKEALRTGVYQQDPMISPKMQVVSNGQIFQRVFSSQLQPDPRTDSWGVSPGSFYENFDFAAPQGYQIDQITLKAKVNGLVHFYMNSMKAGSAIAAEKLPWVLQLDKKMIHENFEQTISLPAGTVLVGINTYSGSRWLETPMEQMRYLMKSAADSREVISWEAVFALSPLAKSPLANSPADYTEFDKDIKEQWVVKYGWDDAVILHHDQHGPYQGKPLMDVYAKDWLVFDDGRDIQIYLKADSRVRIELPVIINSEDDEYNATLVKIRDGSLALIWSRADKDTKMNSGYFVSFSQDMLQWKTPQRLVFEKPSEDFGENKIWSFYSQDRTTTWPGTYEQSYNIFPVTDGYLMLMGPGYVRRSADLVHWGLPEHILPLEGDGFFSSVARHESKTMHHDGNKTSVTTTEDGRIWVVSTFTDREELSPKNSFLPQWRRIKNREDGKTYVDVHFIQVFSSMDGKDWTPELRVALDKYNKDVNGLWVFPVSQSQIAFILMNYSPQLHWTVMLSPDQYQILPSSVNMFFHNGDKAYYLKEGTLICAYPVPHRQRINECEPGMLLINWSKSMYDAIQPYIRK